MIVIATVLFAAIAAVALLASIRVDLVSRGASMNFEHVLHGDLDAACRSANGALHMREQILR
ncbi:hypothetical protein BSZ39_06250 [Bowdeniella nasicola]|uniref:Uncharacterized protein n=1 Tax=Bowdeniella nasicola TaxID=208480 RepID=A0A1Q5Q2M9_9ACTO|nr:hypothetical protein [Bowdeniella nasicola]OKL54056.1 hypothetical protein BSZ39_06250 [Bowdeniella nasicola]